MDLLTFVSPAPALALPHCTRAQRNAIGQDFLLSKPRHRYQRVALQANASHSPSANLPDLTTVLASTSLSPPPPLVNSHHKTHSHVNRLRRHKLALLLVDLVSRITAEFADQLPPSLPPLLATTHQLATDLHPLPTKVAVSSSTAAPTSASSAKHALDDAPLRSSARGLLWRIRATLEPLCPSPALRASLEVARSACLHIPAPAPAVSESDSAHVHPHHEVASHHSILLEVDIALLQELHTLRVAEHRLRHAILARYPQFADHAALRDSATAAAAVGIDDYRVRGKTRLVDAIIELVDSLECCANTVHDSVRLLAAELHDALVVSLQNDLTAKRPAGRAMLLRPRIFDIPNFDRVNDTFLRGGQPTAVGLQWLYDYGVTLVIDLRGSDRQNQWDSPSCRLVEVQNSYDLNQQGHNHQVDDGANRIQDSTDRSEVELMQICNIPIEDFGTPNRQQLNDFIALTNAVRRKGGVVFVHCKAGIGRTGTLVACWRIFQGASVDEAVAKESLYADGGGGLRQETFVREYALSLGRTT